MSQWTNEKNNRRCDLIDKLIMTDEGISSEEEEELDSLQQEMLAYRRKVAPLPLEEVRAAHEAMKERWTL